MTEKLPPLPKGKYEWWDDYYDGLRLSNEPEERYKALGLYDEDQLREYARAAILQERADAMRLRELLVRTQTYVCSNRELMGAGELCGEIAEALAATKHLRKSE